MMRRILILAALTGGCITPAGDGYVTPNEASTMVQRKGAVLVDVREKSELGSGMAKGALWIPSSKFSDDPALDGFIDGLDASRPVVVYCAGGGRAAQLVDVLREKGFKAENMGGFQSWADAGLPVTIPPDSPQDP